MNKAAIFATGLMLIACGGPQPDPVANTDFGGSDQTQPPAPSTPEPSVTGVYWGYFGFEDTDGFGQAMFGNPLLIDAAGRAMWMGFKSDREGYLFDATFSRSGDAVVADVVVRHFPTASRWLGLASGTLDVGGHLDLPSFPVTHDGDEQGRANVYSGYNDENSTGTVDLGALSGHYVATGDTDIDGAFASDWSRFEMDIYSGQAVTIGIGSCWSGTLQQVEAGKVVVRVLDGPPSCPTDEHISGLMAVRETELVLMLTDRDSDRSWLAHFPRPGT